MTLNEILEAKGHKVWSVRDTQTIEEALHTLVDNKIGALLVFDDTGTVVGILSERDIMRECYQSGSEWHESLVSDVMTRRIIIGTPNDTADYAMGIMTQNRIRHIPVMDNGNLCGVISIGDVVKACLKDSRYESQFLKTYIVGV